MGKMLLTRNRRDTCKSHRKIRDITGSIQKQVLKYQTFILEIYKLFGREKFHIKEMKGKIPWSIRTAQNYLRDSKELGFVGQRGIGLASIWWIKPKGISDEM